MSSETFDPRNFLAGEQQHLKRLKIDRLFRWLCIAVAVFCCSLLAFLLITILFQGISGLSSHFFTNPPDPDPEVAGFMPAIWGSVWLLFLTAFFALPIGVSAAIILEEYRPRTKWLVKLHGLIQLNVSNLAGVPSVVYGIIGLTAFAHVFGVFESSRDEEGNVVPALFDPVEVGVEYKYQFYTEENDREYIIFINADPELETVPEALENPAAGTAIIDADGNPAELNIVSWEEDWPTDPALAARTLREDSYGTVISEKSWYYFSLPFGRGVLTGALTLMLVILPVIIIATQESLRAVPITLRQAAEGLGATRWQVVRQVTLPCALPGIMTASIIAMSRAIGEAAPLLMIAGIIFISNPPQQLMDDFTAMPLQIYNWAGRPQAEFHQLAASGIIILLFVLLSFNAIAVFIRQRTQKKMS